MTKQRTSKKLFIALVGIGSIALASSSFAHNIYVGGGFGYSALNTPSGDAFTTTADSGSITYNENSSSTELGGLGGNLFAGYGLNENWAVELGYTNYGESDYDSQQIQYNDGDQSGTSNASLSYKTHTYDLFLRGNMPLTDKFGVFAKAGLSYVNQKVDYTNSNVDSGPDMPINSGGFTTPKLGSNTYTAFRPAGGLGFNFKINDTFSAQMFAQGFLGSGDIDSDQDAIASGYIVGAGVTVTLI